jgi:hypothetical protein
MAARLAAAVFLGILMLPHSAPAEVVAAKAEGETLSLLEARAEAATASGEARALRDAARLGSGEAPGSLGNVHQRRRSNSTAIALNATTGAAASTGAQGPTTGTTGSTTGATTGSGSGAATTGAALAPPTDVLLSSQSWTGPVFTGLGRCVSVQIDARATAVEWSLATVPGTQSSAEPMQPWAWVYPDATSCSSLGNRGNYITTWFRKQNRTDEELCPSIVPPRGRDLFFRVGQSIGTSQRDGGQQTWRFTVRQYESDRSILEAPKTGVMEYGTEKYFTISPLPSTAISIDFRHFAKTSPVHYVHARGGQCCLDKDFAESPISSGILQLDSDCFSGASQIVVVGKCFAGRWYLETIYFSLTNLLCSPSPSQFVITTTTKRSISRSSRTRI